MRNRKFQFKFAFSKSLENYSLEAVYLLRIQRSVPLTTTKCHKKGLPQFFLGCRFSLPFWALHSTNHKKITWLYVHTRGEPFAWMSKRTDISRPWATGGQWSCGPGHPLHKDKDIVGWPLILFYGPVCSVQPVQATIVVVETITSTSYC